PASLALLTVMFTEVHERAKAFAVYGAITGGGAVVGLLMGGFLTQYATWRWCLLVNIPVAAVTFFASIAWVPESRATGATRFDVPGALVVTLGLASLVYGFTKAATAGWDAGVTLAYLGAGVLLLATFALIQRRSKNPLLPLWIVLDRNRGGAYMANLLTAAGL